MKKKKRKMAIRLALREEGPMWNAYLAMVGTMENAKLIGSIGIGIVRSQPEIKQRFLDLMKDTMALAVEEITGQTPEMLVEDAPESERSGNA